jgi:hypothetical protein
MQRPYPDQFVEGQRYATEDDLEPDDDECDDRSDEDDDETDLEFL